MIAPHWHRYSKQLRRERILRFLDLALEFVIFAGGIAAIVYLYLLGGITGVK